MTKTIFYQLRGGLVYLMLFAMLFVVACEEDVEDFLDDPDSDGVVDDDDTTDDDTTDDDTTDDDTADDDEDYVSSLEIESFIVSLSTGEKLLAEVDNVNRVINASGVSSSSLIEDFIFSSNITAFLANPASTILEEWTFGRQSTISFWDTKVFVDYEINLLDYDRGENNIVTIDMSDPDNVKQQVVFIGGDMERSQYNLSNATNKEEVAKWCFEDIDFNVCRISYDKKQEVTEGEKVLETWYANCVEAMELIRDVNPNVEFFGTLKSDYNGYNSQNNLPDWICDYDPGTWFDTDKYACFLVDFLEHFHSKGLTIKYLSTGKEWQAYITPARAKATIEAMIPDLNSRGVPIPLFCDASTWSVSQGNTWVQNVVSQGFEQYYWGFCTHNYNSGDGDTRTYNYQNMVNTANAITTPKDYVTQWDEDPNAGYYSIASETGGASMGANSGIDANSDMRTNMLDAFREKCEIYADGMHGEMIFELWSRGYANESRMVYFTTANPKATRLSNYYAIQSHGNFFQDGMYYLGSEHSNITVNGQYTYLHTMQFANEEQAYVCVINLSDEQIDNLLIDLNDESLYGSVRRHMMDEQTVKVEGTLWGQYFDTALIEGELEIEIPAKSITFLKIDLTERR